MVDPVIQLFLLKCSMLWKANALVAFISLFTVIVVISVVVVYVVWKILLKDIDFR